jgi:hypothetical protein
MNLFHERWRTRVSLLASGCLDGGLREKTLRHLDTCAACRDDHAALLRLLEEVRQDPVREAEPDVALQFLVARVEARLDTALSSPAWRWGWAAASLGIAVLAGALAVRFVPGFVDETRVATTPTAAPVAEVGMDAAALERLERTLAREQAVRYLAEAEDVLVNLRAEARPCPKKHAHVELDAEAERSRELLSRRALLVDLEGNALLPARDVLVDVDNVLREVASLSGCSGRDELERLRREMDERQLLMKVRLLSRELVS